MKVIEEKLLRVKDVKEYIPFSTAKIYRLMNENQFPKSIKVGGSVLWRLSDIKKYVEDVTSQG